MKYSTVFLDMDRTIFDFDAAEKDSFFTAFNNFIGRCNENIYNEYHKINSFYWKEFELGHVNISDLKIMRFSDLFKKLNINFSGKEFNEYYIENLSQSPQIYEGSKEVCKYLKNKYKVIILTNGIAKNQRNRLKLSHIDNYIDYAVISEEIGAAKPQKEIFSFAMKKSGETDKNKIIMIGDDLNADIKGAKNFGIASIWTNYTHNPNTSNVKPDFEISDIQEIYNIL